MKPRPSIAVLIARLGPYHVARMRALGEKMGAERTLAVEIAAGSREYAWDVVSEEGFRRITLIPSAYEDASGREIAQATKAALDREQPEAVAVDGWGFAEARAALAWCRRNGRPAILMSESQERDAERHWAKEWIKARLLLEIDAALVGGARHADYLKKLNFPGERIFIGYDVVDNAYFADGADAARADGQQLRQKLRLPERYLLASARFVPKKNLETLLVAYGRYRAMSNNPFELVLLGDGPERPRILAARERLKLESSVHLPGFVQYPSLPTYYGLASGFILPSTQEQWGLVVNEAMAAGVPVLVSDACGCVDELVINGETGYRFSPSSPEELAARMQDLSGGALHRMGSAARARVQLYGTSRFAEGMAQALAAATVARSGRRSRLPNPMLWL